MRTKFFISDEEILGKKFGLLTPIKRDGRTKDNHRAWLCNCDCGNSLRVSGSCLLNGKNSSCGCNRGKHSATHGLSKHPIYRAWSGMIRRCYDLKCRNYRFYGAKGISVCEEWKNDVTVFFNWSMENGWKEGLSIDRFPDNTGNYNPANCRWTNRENQDNNRTDNVVLECRGMKLTIAQFSRLSGVAPKTISERLGRGWDVEKAILILQDLIGKKVAIIQRSNGLRKKETDTKQSNKPNKQKLTNRCIRFHTESKGRPFSIKTGSPMFQNLYNQN